MCQGFSHFLDISHTFLLAKLSTSSIRVKLAAVILPNTSMLKMSETGLFYDGCSKYLSNIRRKMIMMTLPIIPPALFPQVSKHQDKSCQEEIVYQKSVIYFVWSHCSYSITLVVV